MVQPGGVDDGVTRPHTPSASSKGQHNCPILASYPECEAKHVHVDYIYIVQYVQISWKLTVMISDFLFHIKKFESPSANLLSMYRYMQQGGIPSEPECACVYVRERERERDRSSKQHY